MTDAEVPALFDRQMTVWLPKFYENSRRIDPAAKVLMTIRAAPWL